MQVTGDSLLRIATGVGFPFFISHTLTVQSFDPEARTPPMPNKQVIMLVWPRSVGSGPYGSISSQSHKHTVLSLLPLTKILSSQHNAKSVTGISCSLYKCLWNPPNGVTLLARGIGELFKPSKCPKLLLLPFGDKDPRQLMIDVERGPAALRNQGSHYNTNTHKIKEKKKNAKATTSALSMYVCMYVCVCVCVCVCVLLQ